MIAEPELTERPGLEEAPAPVPRRHRRDSRLATWLAGLALLVVVLAIGSAITDRQLTTEERFREFVVTGETGEPVSTTTFTAVVLGVRPAAVISDDSGRPHTTSGVWLLVRVRAYGIDEPTGIGYAAVRDGRGRSWLATSRIEQPLAADGYRLQPGIPVEAEIAFEVPREAAGDLVLRLATASIDLRLDTVAEVRLPVDERAVAEALGQPEPEPVELVQPEVVIADPQVLRDAEEPSR